MRNSHLWRPTKAVLKNGKLIPNIPCIYGPSYHTIKIQLIAYHKALTKHLNGHLADLGCGNMPYFEVYQDHCSNVTCADITENEFTDSSINLNERFPFDDETFNSVLFADVINHVFNIDNLFAEANRVLIKGGNIIAFTPFLYWISEPPYDFHRFTKFSLASLCEKEGFEIIELESYGKWGDVSMDLIFKKYSSRFSFRLLKGVSDLFLRSPSLNDQLEKFPLGYILVAKKR